METEGVGVKQEEQWLMGGETMAELKEEAASYSSLWKLGREPGFECWTACVCMDEGERQCVCALICVLHVSVRVLQPSLQFKHSLGCHYGLITMSVWLMVRGRALIVLSLKYSTLETTLPTILPPALAFCHGHLWRQRPPRWMWRLHRQLAFVLHPAGSLKGESWVKGWRLEVKDPRRPPRSSPWWWSQTIHWWSFTSSPSVYLLCSAFEI